MKKLLIILLSFLLFFNSSLFIIIYGVRIIGITHAVNEKMEILSSDEIAAETVLIKTSFQNPSINGALQRINSGEILYKGFLYDIASERIIGDSLYIFCLQDNEEDELIKNIITHFENEGNKNPEMQYFNILFTFLSNALIPNYTLNIPGFQSSCKFIVQVNGILRGITEIPSPPPKYIVYN